MGFENDPPAMPSGDGIDPLFTMACAQCAWRSSSVHAGVVFKAAVEHVEETAHQMRYRGQVQDLSRFVRVRQGRSR